MAIQGNCVRTLSPAKDWTYGNNLGGYLTKNAAIAQQINCRLLQFLGECFWDVNAGIDWFGYLGGKNASGLNLAIATVILNTPGVLGFSTPPVFVLNDVTRTFSVNWKVNTTFSKSYPGTANFTLPIAS